MRIMDTSYENMSQFTKISIWRPQGTISVPELTPVLCNKMKNQYVNMFLGRIGFNIVISDISKRKGRPFLFNLLDVRK